MVYGRCQVVDFIWRMPDGGWCVVYGWWRMVHGEWWMVCGWWCMVVDVWVPVCVCVHGLWVMCDVGGGLWVCSVWMVCGGWVGYIMVGGGLWVVCVYVCR